MNDWIELGPLDAIPRRGSRLLYHGAIPIAVFRTAGDEVFALEDRCPHQGGPLSQGIVFDRRVACPLHDWVIALDTGEACGPDEGCTRRYPVQVNEGRVFIQLPGVEPDTAAVAGGGAS